MSHVCLAHYEMLENHIAKLEAELSSLRQSQEFYDFRVTQLAQSLGLTDCKTIGEIEGAVSKLRGELAEARRHSEWQAEKIASLQDKVDGFAGVYNELAETKKKPCQVAADSREPARGRPQGVG